jgi:S-DNA-T family DNA segregation ATPase FtsK/SpoIIIE
MKTEEKQAKQKRAGKDPVMGERKPENSWLQKFQLLIRRSGLDLLGLVMFSIAGLTFLGLFGLTSGNIISRWTQFLRTWFGWGSYVFILVFISLGIWSFRKRIFGDVRFPLGKVIALEVAFFVLIAFLSISGGMDLERASQGLDGGFIGWGLAELLSIFLPLGFLSVLLAFLIILLILIGTGLLPLFIRKVDLWISIYIRDKGITEISDQSQPALSEDNLVPEIKDSGAKLNQFKKQTVISASASQERERDLPPFDLLDNELIQVMDDQKVQVMGEQIEKTLAEFGLPARVAGYRIGPTVTQFALEPGFIEKENPDGTVSKHKVRVSQISSLAKDLALALSAERLRIEAPVPGRSYMGIEVPNDHSKMVRLRSILESDVFQRLNSPLALALGKDVSGQAVVTDLSKMPHILIAGTTGSGKSVCISAITASLLMNNSPDDLRIAMIDPKMVELARFNGVPHLLGKVETSNARMVGVLRWAISEMDQRYRVLEDARARDLESYNTKMRRKKLPTLPRIVIIIDELADLMLSAPEQTETSLVRLAQMARAVGMHLVVATQRPSVDIITGVIKANFPARIAFTMATSIDSRVILDTNGAETLLGKGDMLFLSPDSGILKRAQGVFVSDQELIRVINYWMNHYQKADDNDAPWETLLKVMEEEGGDDLVKQAIDLVKNTRRASASLLQRRLRVGFPRAARLLDQLEEMGVVGPNLGGGRDREVLIDRDDDWQDIPNPSELDD